MSEVKHPQAGFSYRTPEQYCKAANISRATFWRDVKRGKVAVVKFGERCTRVPVREIEPKAAA
jgi:hypothetical protein